MYQKKTGGNKMSSIVSFFSGGGNFEYDHCDWKKSGMWTVNVGFSHSENEEDETQFDIKANGIEELNELFNNFEKENNFKNIKIAYIVVVKTAD